MLYFFSVDPPFGAGSVLLEVYTEWDFTAWPQLHDVADVCSEEVLSCSFSHRKSRQGTKRQTL